MLRVNQRESREDQEEYPYTNRQTAAWSPPQSSTLNPIPTTHTNI